VEVWTEQPAESDVEATVVRYFGLLRVGEFREAEQLLEHSSTRHVLKALWSGSVAVDADEDREEPAADDWERDLSWLRELDLAGTFAWGGGGTRVYVEVTHRERVIEVALSFWVKHVDVGWVLSGPATLW